MMTSIQKTSRRQLWLISTGLLLLILAAFEPMRHNAFIDFDDNSYIVTNYHIQSGLTRDCVRWAFTTGDAANWHPLTWLSHILDIELFGLNPLAHHLHNLALHTFSTFLLFWLLHQMTGRVWCSAFTAMAFGIHPLRVESVAWAAERKDVLSIFFFMLTLAAYLYHIRQGGFLRYAMVLLCFAMGLMAKPMLVTLPFLFLILDIWPLKRNLKISRTRLITEKIPLFILSGISCAVTYQVQQSGGSMAPKMLSLLPRISNALTNVVAYPAKIFWPCDLAILYPYREHLPLWQPIIAFVVLAAITAVVISAFRKQPWLTAGWFWYLISLVPVIGLIQVGSQSMADRYTYLPSIGILIIVSWSATGLMAHWRYQQWISGFLMITAAAAMLITTRTQVSYWKDSISLFEHTLAVTQNNHIIHHSLGWVLAKQGQLDQAAEHFNKALQLWPEFPEANLDMAGLLIKCKEYDQAEQHLRRVLAANPDNAIAYCNLAIISEAKGKTDEAILAYEQAIRCDGDNYEAFNDLGVLKAQCGLLDEAKKCFNRSIQIHPNYSESRRNLGFTFQLENRLMEAISCYQIALDKDPGNYQACCGLAQTLQMTGKISEAVGVCRKALRLRPESPEAMNNLAWLLASTSDNAVRNPSEAIELALKACKLTGFNNADTLDTLAAAYAATGQFEEAVKTAQKAINISLSVSEKSKANEISGRLQLYQNHKSYSEQKQIP